MGVLEVSPMFLDLDKLPWVVTVLDRWAVDFGRPLHNHARRENNYIDVQRYNIPQWKILPRSCYLNINVRFLAICTISQWRSIMGGRTWYFEIPGKPPRKHCKQTYAFIFPSQDMNGNSCFSCSHLIWAFNEPVSSQVLDYLIQKYHFGIHWSFAPFVHELPHTKPYGRRQTRRVLSYL